MVKRVIVIAIAALILASAGYVIVRVRRHGFSAEAEPSRLEKWMARHARKIATPPDAKTLRNPYPTTPDSLARGREHFAEHCALCHGFDGRGATTIGRNLYPKAPDMTDAETQELTDGELFYIIQNGVRFTGMPAWRSEHTAEQTWELVSFLRHLPRLTLEEMEQMRRAGAGGATPEHTHQHDEHSGAHPH